GARAVKEAAAARPKNIREMLLAITGIDSSGLFLIGMMDCLTSTRRARHYSAICTRSAGARRASREFRRSCDPGTPALDPRLQHRRSRCDILRAALVNPGH